MKLLKSEVDKSLVTKLDRSIRSDAVKGYVMFGKNNDYPEVIERIINNSVTAKAVTRIYAKFLTGQGFTNEDLNEVVIATDNRGKKITLRNLLSSAASSIAMFNGVYLHCNVNLDRKVGSVKMVPFKHCRFAKFDDRGYTAKIGVYDNWTKDTEDGKTFDKNKIVWHNVFNLEEAAFVSMIKKEAKGDITKYKGQVYFQFFDNQYTYPLSPIDPVYMDADTEYQIELFKNRGIRNGLLDKTVFRVASTANDTEKEELEAGIRKFIGPDGDSVLVLEDEIDPETGQIKKTGAFAIDKIESNINDKLFENWEKNLANNIRKSLSAIPSVLIDYDESKLGTTSGEGIIQATNFYNSVTSDDRRQLSEIFKEIFSHWHDETLAANTDWSIKQLSLYENGTPSII